MGGAYPELRAGRDAVVRTVRAEEERFDTVLTSGLPKLEDLLDRTVAAGSTVVSGDEIFRLYDSLGVPLDFAEDLAEQRGLSIDRAAYEHAMEAQRERARSKSAFDTKKGAAAFTYASDATRQQLEAVPDVFEGYTSTEVRDAVVLALFDEDRKQSNRLTAGATGYVVLDRTPFYVESGGQVSDAGDLLAGETVSARVTAMSRLGLAGPRVHRVTVLREITAGDRVTARVHMAARDATRRHHTATHLLHAALRERLGTHVQQKGSLVSPDRLRFDFAHSQPVDDADRRWIETAVNAQVFRNAPVTTAIKSIEDAKQSGAMALFGEKYGDKVRVVTVPGYSVELCGGTHVSATGEIGPFVIVEESGVAAGIRRIEALCGAAAVSFIQARLGALDDVQALLGAKDDTVTDSLARLQAESKRLARENAQLKMKLALGGGSKDESDDAVAVGDAKLIARRVTGLEKDALRALADSLRDRIKRGVVVLAAEQEDKVHILVSVTKDLTARVKAGALVKELAPIVGGGGGGRPDFAEAGGKDASKIDVLLDQAKASVTAALA
jgi:alanyl-tRNA synthetase